MHSGYYSSSSLGMLWYFNKSSKSSSSKDSGKENHSPLPLLLIGLIFHLIYIASIFDIFFVSPVVRVSNRYSVQELDGASGERSPADRIVLIVGDGLRADKTFQDFPDPPFDLSTGINIESPPLPISPNLNRNHTSKDAIDARLKLPSGLTTPTPYLRGLIDSGQASWGISETRVPTESRPGHVALIGGMYEDVSAVLKGWKTNPLTFDTTFNQSSHTFSFGSPDILPMFKLGSNPQNKVDTRCYQEGDEDFTKDATQLDTWVLTRLQELFHNASTSSSSSLLNHHLHQPGLIIFLHLLGLDTTGHSYRPHSPEYYRNLRTVDRIVEETVREVEGFFENDGRTGYVFTADHGMSNIGNHGDGHPDNTRTPLIVWGSGVNQMIPKTWETPDHPEWGTLGKIKRRDVEQADVAPLMSVLAGIPLPANSEGRLPLDYLDSSSPEFKAKASLTNALQLVEGFRSRDESKRSKTFRYKPFPKLGENPIGISEITKIKSLIQNGEFEQAQNAAIKLGELALEGSNYLQTYDWFILRCIVVAGYLGWIAISLKFSMKTLLHRTSPSPPSSSSSSSPSSSYSAEPPSIEPALALSLPGPSYLIGISVFIAVSSKFFWEHAPISYYAYLLFPCLFWAEFLNDISSLIPSSQQQQQKQQKMGLGLTGNLLIPFLLSTLSLQGIVIGYFHREIWTLGMTILGFGWPLLAMESSFKRKNAWLVKGWMMACSSTGVFTLLPVEKGENLTLIFSGAFCFMVASLFATGSTTIFTIRRGSGAWGEVSSVPRYRIGLVWGLQSGFILLSILNTFWSAKRLQRKQGLGLINLISGWTIFVTSAVIPLRIGVWKGQDHLDRLLVLVFAFAPAFITLSISYEVLFLFCFVSCVCLWMVLEHRLALFNNSPLPEEEKESSSDSRSNNKLTCNNGPTTLTTKPSSNLPLKPTQLLRISLTYLFFVHVGFFGTGNIASISSFYLEPVYRLVPIFDPFLMASLLLLKIFIPFFVVGAVFITLTTRLGLKPLQLLLFALGMSDVLTLNFFFLVTDKGSWLEIGQSISHFSIASLLIIFTTLLSGLGRALMSHTV